MIRRPDLITRTADQGQDIHEDVDDVQVEVEGSEDVLFGTDAVLVFAAHHQLRIEH